MSVLYENNSSAADADDGSDRLRCSCLSFCFGRRGSATRSSGATGKPQRLRRRRRFRIVIRLSSWLAFSWPPPWLRMKKSGKECTKSSSTGKKKRTGRRLLLLLKTSLQAKQALASVVVSGGDGGGLLPVATVSSFGDAKKQHRPAADGTAPPSGTRSQPRASTAATGTGSGSTAPALPWTSRPCKTAVDEPAMAPAGRIWRAPSRRHSLQPQPQPVRASSLWTAATTLGVIVLFGRVTAVVFLCSCLYGARFIRARAAGARAKNSGVDAGASSSSRRLGDPIGVAGEKIAELCVTEECKKKVVMAGLLERRGKGPSSRFER